MKDWENKIESKPRQVPHLIEHQRESLSQREIPIVQQTCNELGRAVQARG